MSTEQSHKSLTFIKGGQHIREGEEIAGKRTPLEVAKTDFNEILSSRNLTFLFGSGCSSHKSDLNAEMGIPTMGPLASGILAEKNQKVADAFGLTVELRKDLNKKLGLDLSSDNYADNLERLLEVLYGFQFALDQTTIHELQLAKTNVDSAIDAVKRYVFSVCLNGQMGPGAGTVLQSYQVFYRKLSQRSRSLPRPTVATTNYDLFNEFAMDRAGIPYFNGFLGSVERRFNPSSFRYTLAQRLDLSSKHWSSVDNLIYFVKLHGSLNWHASESGLFPVEERPLELVDEGEAMLIYPTPAKQNASFSAPYSDMFREFQTRVIQDQSALVVVGYGFGDEHVNNIIFQGLTIPTFRLVVFAKPEPIGSTSQSLIRKLQALNDPRVWIIGTETSESEWKAHYFEHFVNDIMPAGPSDPAESAIEKVIGMVNLIQNGESVEI